MLDSLKLPCRRETRYTVLHLARKVSPPIASVLVQIRATRSISAAESFMVSVDGRKLPHAGFERVQVDDRTVQIIVHGDSFSWLRTTTGSSRVEIVLGERVLFRGDVEVAPFQA